MRRTAVGATLVAAVLATAAPAVARAETLYSGTLDASGAITASWHGDPARGCAAAGLCAYRGSVTARPGEYGAFELVTDGDHVTDAFGFADLGRRPVAR